MSKPAWKTVKIREADYTLLAGLRQTLLEEGIDGLSDPVRAELANGPTQGAVLAAAIAALREAVVKRPARTRRAR